MTTLNKIVEDIKKNKTLAEEQIGEDSDPRTLKGRLGRKNSAKERLKSLYREYKKTLVNKMAMLLVTGSKAEEFCEIAQSEGNMFLALADNLYEDISTRIPEPVIKRGMKTAAILDILSRHLEDKATELDIASYPAIVYKTKYEKRVENSADMLELTKTIINNEVGPELVGFDVLEQVSRQAVNDMFDGKILPVVVLLKDDSIVDEVVEGLKKIGAVSTVLAGEGKAPKNSSKVSDVTKEQVFSVLKKMQKQVSSKSKGE